VRAFDPDHSSRETSHPESKLLKKYESKPHKRPLCPDRKPPSGEPRRGDIARIALISLYIPYLQRNAGNSGVYPALTIFGKDCGHISQKRRQRILQAGHRRYLVAFAAKMACTTSGNGEQAWL
jgi:hypothetical protein